MATPVRLLSVGALTLDTILRVDAMPVKQGKFIASEGIQIASGMATSAACAAKRLGAAVSLWASVGDDAVGDQLIAGIEAEGVDCAHVRRVPGARSALASIVVDAHGERIIVPFYDRLAQADPEAAAVRRYRRIRCRAGRCALAWRGRTCPRGGTRRRPAGDPRRGHRGKRRAGTAAAARLPHRRFRAGREDSLQPGARPAPFVRGARPAHRRLRRRNRRRGGNLVVRPRGWRRPACRRAQDQGCRYAGGRRRLPRRVCVGLAEAMPVEQALRFASAAAALKCLRFGGRLGAPDRAETLAMVAATWPGEKQPQEMTFVA
jgi:sulfofructose kinase